MGRRIGRSHEDSRGLNKIFASSPTVASTPPFQNVIRLPGPGNPPRVPPSFSRDPLSSSEVTFAASILARTGSPRTKRWVRRSGAAAIITAGGDNFLSCGNPHILGPYTNGEE